MSVSLVAGRSLSARPLGGEPKQPRFVSARPRSVDGLNASFRFQVDAEIAGGATWLDNGATTFANVNVNSGWKTVTVISLARVTLARAV